MLTENPNVCDAVLDLLGRQRNDVRTGGMRGNEESLADEIDQLERLNRVRGGVELDIEDDDQPAAQKTDRARSAVRLGEVQQHPRGEPKRFPKQIELVLLGRLGEIDPEHLIRVANVGRQIVQGEGTIHRSLRIDRNDCRHRAAPTPSHIPAAQMVPRQHRRTGVRANL